MAKTIIREYDMSRGNLNTVSDFAVVVPGFVGDGSAKDDPSKNGIYRLTSVSEFVQTIGKLSAGNCGNHLGNQIAYELLTLGYTVYFKAIPEIASTTDPEQTDWLKSKRALADEENDFWLDFRDNKTYRDVRYLVSGMDPADPDYAELASGIAKVMNATVNYINNPGNESEEANFDEDINDNGRGDAIALLDFSEINIDDSTIASLLDTTETNIKALGQLSRYSSVFGPEITYNKTVEKAYDDNATFPASFHYLACAAYSQERFAEWYAVAGYNRGIARYQVASANYNYGNLLVNKIAPRRSPTEDPVTAANLIINERGNYYLWGNRTAEPLYQVGLKYRHFLNIRQLCTTLKKQILYATNNLEFNPNSDRLWVDFEQAVSPILRRMQADQGIRGFEITRKKNQGLAVMSARIRIIPIEAVEDFDISLGLVDNLDGGANVILYEE